MAGYVSKFATGATIEAILDKADKSQSVSAAEKTAWNNKQNALTFDTTPTEGSTNPVTSDGVYKATVKTLTYTGTGEQTNTITFPDTPTVILSIDGMGLENGYVSLSSFRFGAQAVNGCYFNTQNSQNGEIRLRASVDGNTLTLSMGVDAGAVCNTLDEQFTVVYI